MLIALLISGCDDDGARNAGGDGGTDGGAGGVEAARTEQISSSAPVARSGIRFDPAQVREGDSIGVLVLDSIDAQPNVVDSTLVGMARFRGRIELSGHVMEHPDEDARRISVCFAADSASATRLPRWLHDERRASFCFTNPEATPGPLRRTGHPATVVIDSFTIHRGLSDQVNSAHFRGTSYQDDSRE